MSTFGVMIDLKSTRWSRILWILMVLIIPAWIISNHFAAVFACPSCYLFVEEGDGLKNYFTLLYYVQHDSGWHFTGMNYPYGEHIIYTDNQPILAILLQKIDRHIIDLDRHVIGIMNMLMLASIYVGVLLTYKLQQRWGIDRWWAFASSMCIILLSPQLWRMHGHYGLSYVAFLPALFLMIDYLTRSKSKKIWWTAGIILLVCVISLIHMYFLLISLVVISAFTFFWWLYYRKQKELVKTNLPHLLLSIVIPVIILFSIKGFTDDVQDRPTEPWGLDSNTITFETTFFPFIPPLDKAWTEIVKHERPSMERIAYTGVIGLLMLPVILYFLFRKKQSDDDPQMHIKAFLGAAIVSWLMAAGVLYQNGFKFLWEIIPMLKQFRGLGRFGFSFYYLYMLVCSYLIWQLYLLMRSRDLQKAGRYLLFAILLLWGFEAWLNIKAVAAPVFRTNKFLSDKKDDYVPLLQAAGYQPDQFQAILQIPIVAVGPENIGFTKGLWTLREGIHASAETGLPLMGFSLSRTGVSQGVDLLELVSTPYNDKRRALLFDERPILLLCEEEFVTPTERYWISKAQKIGTYGSITLYSLSPEEFSKKLSPSQITTDSNCVKLLREFEENKNPIHLTGEGALQIEEAPFSIWSYTDTSQAERNWKVSFWSYIDNKKGNTPVPRMMEKNPEGHITQNVGLHRENIMWEQAKGNWIEVAFPLVTKGKGFQYELFIDNVGPIIDNLMIYPANDTCITIIGGTTLINNIPIEHK